MICCYETEHYVFHFLENSLAARDIGTIAAEQEKSYEKICGLLNVRFPRKINYWLYESPDVVGRYFCDGEPCNGLAIDSETGGEIGTVASLSGKDEDRFTVEPFSVHAVYEERIKCIGEHEDTHVIMSQICPEPVSSFLAEGIAMFMDGTWWGRENRLWAREFRENGELIDTAEVICIDQDQFYDMESAKTYPVGGAWTEFIAERFGMDKFLRLYCSENPDRDAKEIFGKSLSELHEMFAEWLV